MSPSDLDWQRITDEAVSILTCEVCAAASTDGLPQPFWVGEDYRPGGVVLVARNPASKELPPAAKRLLERLREERNPVAFMEWSRWRIAHMTGKPWTQWKLAFSKAVAGCLAPEQLAWLNVAPFATRNDAAPSAELRLHGRDQHLAPMLIEVLCPVAVVTRYTAAEAAVSATSGPRQIGGVFPINGRVATNRDTTDIRERLRDSGLCGASISSRVQEGGAMGRVEGDESVPDARELVKQRLRSRVPDRRSDGSVVDHLLVDRQADLELEDTRWQPPEQS